MVHVENIKSINAQGNKKRKRKKETNQLNQLTQYFARKLTKLSGKVPILKLTICLDIINNVARVSDPYVGPNVLQYLGSFHVLFGPHVVILNNLHKHVTPDFMPFGLKVASTQIFSCNIFHFPSFFLYFTHFSFFDCLKPQRLFLRACVIWEAELLIISNNSTKFQWMTRPMF